MKRLVILIVAAALGASLVAGLATARTAAPVAKAEGDIVQTAVASGQFKTLAKLLTRAGLVSALEQPGPFTVFAPTDAAFKKVPDPPTVRVPKRPARRRALAAT